MESIHKIAQKYIIEVKDANLRYDITYQYTKSLALIHQAKIDYQTALSENRLARANMELIINKL